LDINITKKKDLIRPHHHVTDKYLKDKDPTAKPKLPRPHAVLTVLIKEFKTS
jgi:hypothetical protein